MTITALTGTRLRERRLALGLRQADVARDAGVSASYLNLIEHNRRRIGADVLERLAKALGVAVETLSEGAGNTLIADLRTAAAAVSPAGAQAETDRIEDFAGRFPGWAQAVAILARRAEALERAVVTLNDRMSHDPHLSASLHEVLSAVSSVRSTASILVDTEDIEPEWRARFHRNLHEDSERLATGAEALVAYLDSAGTEAETAVLSPQDEVEQWLSGRGWHLPELEPDGVGPSPAAAEVAGLASLAARQMAQDLLAGLVRDYAALPAERIVAAEARHGPDPLRIAQEFGLDPIPVMRRMALRSGSRLGLVICDGSGTLVFRKPAEGFVLPRLGAACPLWPLYAALSRPASAVVQMVEMPGTPVQGFRIRAWCRTLHPAGFGGPELREAAMLIEPVGSGEAGQALAIGTSCRICPRDRCPARREPSILTSST